MDKWQDRADDAGGTKSAELDPQRAREPTVGVDQYVAVGSMATQHGATEAIWHIVILRHAGTRAANLVRRFDGGERAAGAHQVRRNEIMSICKGDS